MNPVFAQLKTVLLGFFLVVKDRSFDAFELKENAIEYRTNGQTHPLTASPEMVMIWISTPWE